MYFDKMTYRLGNKKTYRLRGSVVTRSRYGFPILFAVFLMVASLGMAQTSENRYHHRDLPHNEYSLSENSSMALSGEASITEYRCVIQEMATEIRVGNFGAHHDDPRRAHDVHVDLQIPVMQIECGKKPMNQDLREALKADQYSYIQFKLLDAQRASPVSLASLDSMQQVPWFDIEVTGEMSIAGVKRHIKVECEGKPVGQHKFRIRGAKKLNMRDFDITPPTAMFGLIKADDWLTVHFDVTVQRTAQSNP